MEHHELLETIATESDTFVPQQSFFIGVDVLVEDVTVQWLSPGDVWVDLFTFTSPGRWWGQCSAIDMFRCVTSSAGSRCWGTW